MSSTEEFENTGIASYIGEHDRSYTTAVYNVSGNARAHFGDVYHNLCPVHPIVLSKSVQKFHPVPLRKDRLEIRHGQRLSTTSPQPWQIQLLWLFSLTKYMFVVQSPSERETTTRMILNLFGKFMLILGLRVTIGREFSLSFHRPKFRNVVPSDSPFFEACERGDVAGMRFLVANGRAGYDDVDEEGESSFFYAIRGGSVEAVLELLIYGADIDTVYGQGQLTPLSDACLEQNVAIIRLLLARGADQQHITALGHTPLFYLWTCAAVDENRTTILRALECADPCGFSYSSKVLTSCSGNLLMHAVPYGTPNDLAFLLDLNVNMLDHHDDYGWHTVFYACRNGQLDKLHYLIEQSEDFDINMRDERGCTLLHVALYCSCHDIVRYLLELGADWQAQTNSEYQDFTEPPYYHFMLAGSSLTPQDFARRRGYQDDFLRIVEEVRGSLN